MSFFPLGRIPAAQNLAPEMCSQMSSISHAHDKFVMWQLLQFSFAKLCGLADGLYLSLCFAITQKLLISEPIIILTLVGNVKYYRFLAFSHKYINFNSLCHYKLSQLPSWVIVGLDV